MKKNKYIAILAIFSSVVLFFSCESLGGVAQTATAIGQATGLLNAQQADIVNKSGVAVEAWGKAFEEITPEQEYYIGRAVGANVLGTYKLQTNRPEMTAYINRIVQTLAINSPRPEIFNGYHANILDSNEINAFATPGGHVFLTRGLIATAASEDALAAVIAHEIAHIQLQHGLKAIKNSRFTQALADSGSAVGSATGRTVAQETETFGVSINEIMNSMMTNGYSQIQEFDADSTAMALLSMAGYQPSALVEMLKVLEKDQPGKPGGFNKTHPTPAQRISNAQRTVNNYSIPDTRSHRQARFAAVR